MKIWILNHYASTMYGNNGGRHYWFSKYLEKNFFESVLIGANTVHNSNTVIDVKGKYEEKEKNNIKFIFLKVPKYYGNGIGRLFNMFMYFIKILTFSGSYKNKMGKPDIIYASSVHPLTCVAGIILAKRYKIKCICEVRDLWPLALILDGSIKDNGFIAKILYSMEHWIYCKSDALIFTMEGGKQYINDMKWDEEVNLKKVYHINNGVDLEAYDYLKSIDYRDTDLDRNDVFKVIYTGSIRPSNDLFRIIKVAEILMKTKYKDNILFLIFGDGTDKLSLELYCKEHCLTNVIFKGNVNKKYIPNILSKSNLNIINYEINAIKVLKYGGSQNKLFEYLASGKPIISNITMNYSLIEKYNCGKSLDGLDDEKMASLIIDFYNLPIDEYDQYCQNARHVAQMYDFKELTKKLEKVIKNTLNNNHNEN